MTNQKHPQKRFPQVGACGLECGLCPRYHTEGVSRCPGCCGPDFWQVHPAGCGFITCCVKQRGLETCAQCPEWKECPRVTKNLEAARDSFISYQQMGANYTLIQGHGLEEFVRRVMKKQGLLKRLLTHYNDGRSKGFYCLSCQLLPPDILAEAVSKIEAGITEGTDIKEKVRFVRNECHRLADSLKIALKLRT